jgi:hypothetical protein
MKRDVEHALCHYLIRKRIKAADLPDKAITIGKLANDLKREDPRWATLKKNCFNPNSFKVIKSLDQYLRNFKRKTDDIRDMMP